MNPQEDAFVQGVTCQPDPCLTQKGSILRFAVLTLLFFTMFGGVGFLILFMDRPFGIQLSTIVIYTAAVALYTFSRNRNNMQPFLLSWSGCSQPISPAHPPTSRFSCCPLRSSDNGPQNSSESACILDYSTRHKPITICRHLGRSLWLPRNRRGTQQS
jgi:hypothetical protein